MAEDDISTQMAKLLRKINEIRSEQKALNEHIKSFWNRKDDSNDSRPSIDLNAPSYSQYATKEPNSRLRDELLKQRTAKNIDLSHRALLAALDAVEKAFVDIRATRNAFDRILKDRGERDEYVEWLKNQK